MVLYIGLRALKFDIFLGSIYWKGPKKAFGNHEYFIS